MIKCRLVVCILRNETYWLNEISIVIIFDQTEIP